MNTIQSLSLLAIVFGIIILAAPQILAYMVALFFIILGINGLMFGAKLNNVWKVKIKE